MMETSDLIARTLSRFAELSSAQVELVSRVLERNRKRVDPRSQIAKSGEMPGFGIVILEGWAVRYRILRDGGRQFLAFLLPGDICADGLALGKIGEAIAAITAVRYAVMPPSAFEDLAALIPSMTGALWKSQAQQCRIQCEWIASLGRRNSKMRIAHLLCELCARLEALGQGRGGVYDFPLTQTDLADATGLTSVHVNRTLQQLRSDGFIELGRGRLFIKDPERMRNFAEFDPDYLGLRGTPVAAAGDPVSSSRSDAAVVP